MINNNNNRSLISSWLASPNVSIKPFRVSHFCFVELLLLFNFLILVNINSMTRQLKNIFFQTFNRIMYSKKEAVLRPPVIYDCDDEFLIHDSFKHYEATTRIFSFQHKTNINKNQQKNTPNTTGTTFDLNAVEACELY
jgi:hypothetical protein